MITLKEYLEGEPEFENMVNECQTLIRLCEGVDIKVGTLQDRVAGFATHEKIILSNDLVDRAVMLFFYAALHELAHYKRMQKTGIDFHIQKLSSPDFDEFFRHVVFEEIIADRYAAKIYYQMFGKKCPYGQNLHLDSVQTIYKPMIKDGLFGKINFNLDNYNKISDSLIVNGV
jgi:hypothetical protein